MSHLRRLSSYTAPHLANLVLVFFLLLLGVGLELLKPWPLKLIVDQVLGGEDLPHHLSFLSPYLASSAPLPALTLLTLATVLIFLSGWLVTAMRSYLQTGIANRMVYSLALDLFDRLQFLSLRFHGEQPTGDLVQRVTSDSECLRKLWLGGFIPGLTALLSMVSMTAVMWQLHSTLCIVALLVVPLLIWLIRHYAGPMEARAYEEMEAQGRMLGYAEQTLSAILLVQSNAQAARLEKEFHAHLVGSARAYLKNIAAQLRFKLGTSSATAVGTALVMLVGGRIALRGEISTGTLLVFLSYLQALYSPLETLAYLSSSISAASAGARRVFEVLDDEDAVEDAPGAPDFQPGLEGNIALEDVTFGYLPSAPVLKGINLQIRAGEKIALVGPTGAGKSTLASLLLRFYDPWEGRITFDGVDIRDVRLKSLREQVSVVLQDQFLLPLSIAENIAYGRPDATLKEIQEAARAAQCHEFIQRLPETYQHQIADRGASLSGGERQRLSIARALLRNSPILILDEPTSALDADSEEKILQALDVLLKNRTCIIIAHRFSTVQKADRILTLEDGHLREGSLRELHRLFSLKPGVGGWERRRKARS